MKYLFVLTLIALSVVIGLLITDMDSKDSRNNINDSEQKKRNKD